MTITVQSPVLSKTVKYGEPGAMKSMRICKVPVSFNGSITEAIAHCTGVTGPDGAVTTPEDDAPLKWANIPSFTRQLVGGMTVYLGLFEIHDDGVYLHSVSDTFPKKPVITEPGRYVLGFRIDSSDHCTRFYVTLDYADHAVSLGG